MLVAAEEVHMLVNLPLVLVELVVVALAALLLQVLQVQQIEVVVVVVVDTPAAVEINMVVALVVLEW